MLRKASDSKFAMERVKRIDKEVSKMFPSVKAFFNKTLRENNKKGQDQFYKDLKELMFEGDLSKKVGNTAIYKRVLKQMEDGGLNEKSQQIIFDAIYTTQDRGFVKLLNTIKEGSVGKGMLPKNMRNMPGLLGDGVKLMIGSTYKIFSNPAVDGLSGFKPSEEAIQKK